MAALSGLVAALWGWLALAQHPDPPSDSAARPTASPEPATATRTEAASNVLVSALAPLSQAQALAPLEGTPRPPPAPGARLVEEVRNGFVTRTHYDANGLATHREVVRDDGTLMMTTVLSPDGEPLTRGYDVDGDGEIDIWVDHSYDAAGQLSSTNVHSEAGTFETEVVFDEQGRRLASETYDEAGRLRGQALYDEDGNRVGYESYDEHGDLNYRTVDELGPEGALQRRDEFDDQDRLRERQHYQDGRVAASERFDEEGRSLGTSERYYDEDGHSVGSDTFAPDGALIERVRLELDEHGRPALETRTDGQGRLLERVTFDGSGPERAGSERYEDGALVERSAYDERGHLESRERLGADGQIDERTTFEDRTPVLREEYSDGQLTTETVYLRRDDGARLGTETWTIAPDGSRTLTQRCLYEEPCAPRDFDCRLRCELF